MKYYQRITETLICVLAVDPEKEVYTELIQSRIKTEPSQEHYEIKVNEPFDMFYLQGYSESDYGMFILALIDFNVWVNKIYDYQWKQGFKQVCDELV
jgi:hypothetical protein